MGVHGLWELLAPVGRRVSVETLAGKKLAIDASIWMIQFMKAMRDEQGEMVRNAHILGFFRRICKLLYLRTKPVFVFDGGTPALKRRTVIARRRQRENAQAKIRKTAEKLLLNHLKTLRLKELAADLQKQRQDNDIKGKRPVIPETSNEPGEQKQGDDVAANLNQEELDEMLAASIAAEENEGFIFGASTSGAPEGEVFYEDDDEDEEMILPEMHGKVDPAILAALPPSVQLDLLVQMRERLMAENRQKYQKVKKAPARFSELQIESYLKTVAFRRDIDGVRKSAAGTQIHGVQTSRIASEANREFIFSSSFTGDKEALASVGQERNVADQSQPQPEESTANAINKDQPAENTNAVAGPTLSESVKALNDEVETYFDDRGLLRVSRVRALGIRMTRDLQRNLDLMKEMDQEKAEQSKQGNSDLTTDINNGVDNEVDKSRDPVVVNGASIEISFEDTSEPDEFGGNDDGIFARLVAGDPITGSPVHNSVISKQSSHPASDNEWEEGVIEGKGIEYQNEVGLNDEEEIEWEDGDEIKKHSPKGSAEEAYISQEIHENRASDGKSTENARDMSDDGEVTWEEGFEDIHLKSSSCPGESNSTSTKGALEEEAALQEAIKRSLEDASVCKSKVDFRENHTAEKARGMAGEGTDPVFARVGKDVATSSMNNIYSEAEASSFIEASPERINVDAKLLYQDSNGLAVKKLVDSCSEKAGHNRSSSAFTDTSHNRVLDSGSAEAKLMFQAEIDEHLSSTQTPGKTSADDIVTDFDDLSKDEIEGHISMAEEVKRNPDHDHRLEEEMLFLGKEREELGSEQRRLERDAESVSNDMFAECQELLQMFGLPYIIAPMEAEAQCAFMELSNLVDGVVTDDSDSFLFGAQCVFKNIFDERKYVETYLMKDIENELGIDREKLIQMALLLGSDYTEGISGVGIVNAIEVVNAFHGIDGLREFREWIESPDPSILGKLDAEPRKKGSNNTDEAERKKEIFKTKHRNVSKNWHVSSSFPSDAVISAYTSPQVDKSTEPFAWGKPDLFVLRKLCWEKFSWGASKADELLLPVLKEYNKHETQLRLEAFYTFNERFAKIRSKRIEKAVKGITGPQSSPLIDEKTRKSSGRGKKRKVNPHVDEGSLLDEDSMQTNKKNSRNGGGRQRGRGRGRGRKKADTKPSCDDTSSSEKDEETQSNTSKEAHQLRRSGRVKKNVNYNSSDEVEKGVTFLEESIKESHVDQEISHADFEPLDETQGMDEMDVILVDDVQMEVPSNHGEDYLQFGGGFCLDDDKADDDSNEHNVLAGADQESDPPLATPRPSNGETGMLDNAVNTNPNTLGENSEEDSENCNAVSLRAMPNLRRKRRAS